MGYAFSALDGRKCRFYLGVSDCEFRRINGGAKRKKNIYERIASYLLYTDLISLSAPFFE